MHIFLQNYFLSLGMTCLFQSQATVTDENSAWRDRIPFVLLFQVATSSDLFEARLPTSAVRLLEGRVFTTEYSHDAFDEIFKSVCLAPKDRKKPSIWPGADATKALLEQSKEQLATPESLMLSMKVYLHGKITLNMFTDVNSTVS